MTDTELLFLVLALVYGWECACWIRRGSVLFVTWFGARWRIRHPGTLLGNQQGGFVFAPPLPPLGTIFLGHQFPLSLSPEAALAYVASSLNPGWRPVQSGNIARFDEMRVIDVKGRKVRVNGELLVKAPSATLAAHLSELLRQLSKLDPAKRSGAIQELIRDSLDTKAIKRRCRQFHTPALRLRMLTNSLFLYLFLFAPLLIWSFGLRQTWRGLLAGLLAFTITTAILFRRAHRNLYPSAEDERFTHFLTVLLSPATTMRAHDTLSRPLLENFHPLAIAKVLCSRDQFHAFARTVLRDIRHPGLPICPHDRSLARATEQFSRDLWLRALEKFLKQSGIAPEELTCPPEPADETCRSYCPRCLAQFTTDEGACADCGGLALKSFSAGAAETKTTAAQ